MLGGVSMSTSKAMFTMALVNKSNLFAVIYVQCPCCFWPRMKMFLCHTKKHFSYRWYCTPILLLVPLVYQYYSSYHWYINITPHTTGIPILLLLPLVYQYYSSYHWYTNITPRPTGIPIYYSSYHWYTNITPRTHWYTCILLPYHWYNNITPRTRWYTYILLPYHW